MSVVVIVYNDAARLPRAVASVLAQSLRGVEVIIVDDASTDDTPRVAERLTAGHSGRVRSVRLPVNSGGCGRPRNAGIELARGRYVMFLDSDDTLDRHACMNLLAAAEETGADLVSGRCVRVFADRERNWYPDLYLRRQAFAGIAECPDLLYDTLSTNKCYRREFLEREQLRFVDGLHYEDLLFSAQAYLAAQVIAVIPHRVYNWFVVSGGTARSITNRRAELRNFSDRLEIHRRIDAAFRERRAGELALGKQVKFLNHDLLLYLRELRSRDAEYRAAFLDLARGYLAELDPAVFTACNPIPGIAGLLILQDDADAAMSAADYAAKKGARPVLSADLVERDGRIYWTGRHLDTALGRRVLDVSDLGIHSMPLGELRLGGRVTTARVDGRSLHLAGDVVNPLGRIPDGAAMTGTLEIRDRRRRRRAFRVPATVRHDGSRIAWTTALDTARRLRPLGLVDQTWGLWLILKAADEKITVRLTGDGTAVEGVLTPVRPRLSRLAGDHAQTYVAESGELALRIVGLGLPARLTLPALQRAAATRWGRRWWRRFVAAEKALSRRLTARSTKIAVFNRLLIRLPVKRGTIVFESHLGAQYSDNPKYIYERLRRRGGGRYRAIWSYQTSPKGFPSDARLVRRGSWAYYRALAQAEFWIDDQGFPAELVKRRRTTYLQTWHGSAFKRMGFDEPSVKQAPQAEQRRMRSMVDRFDYFIVRSDHDTRTLVPGLGVTATRLPVGYPRNDALVNGPAAGELAALRDRLGIAGDRTVVLYAPTFRPDENGRPATRFEVPFDLDRFARDLGDTHVLLVRAHYLSTTVVPSALRHAVIDVSAMHDITPLLLLADALITDYSSVMFDYALRDRPIIFYTPDGRDYLHQRGAYFDLAAHAPGPVIVDDEALLAALGDLDAIGHHYAQRRKEFVESFGEHDTGTAAQAIVDRFFPGAIA